MNESIQPESTESRITSSCTKAKSRYCSSLLNRNIKDQLGKGKNKERTNEIREESKSYLFEDNSNIQIKKNAK